MALEHGCPQPDLSGALFLYFFGRAGALEKKNKKKRERRAE